MPKLITWFVDNPVAANLLMFILVAAGLLPQGCPQRGISKYRDADRDGYRSVSRCRPS